MDPSCTYAAELYDLVPLQVVQWLYVIMSIVTVGLVAYTAFNYLQRTIFENVTKELILALYSCICVYSTFLIIIQLTQLIYRYTASDKCDAQIPKAWCLFRYFLTMLVISFITLHIGITAQHALSTFLFRARAQKIAARISIVASVVYPTALGIFAYSNDSLAGRTPYCSGITAGSVAILMADLYVLLALDIFNTLASLLLWKYNRDRLTTDRQSFDLTLSFHRRQNLYAMQQFLPIAFVHAIVYSIFFVSVIFTEALQSMLSRGWYMVFSVIANVIPWYCLLCPLMFLFLIRRGHFLRASHVKRMINPEKDLNMMYFDALRDQWQ